ncbi:B12-binding domain-containing radical SAM protein [Desulfopila sp. IMCC35008]|uniref:B12-binding domain-containing radical SAM protein n=1 Tax=Desulfopila sp. IMCC35008 TaxID=2653858 RepID=UPI0013D4E1C1|nr:radical SAM protein [Desulfopila sp. IMCC35008]
MNSIDKKRILLVHPLGYSSEQAARDVSRLANVMPPLGLASISAYLLENGFDNDIVDCYAHPDSDGMIREYLSRFMPGYIGFSCTTSTFLDGIRLAEMAKKVVPGIRTIFGGVHMSALQKELLVAYPVIDFGVVGEGEQTLLELLSAQEGACTDVEGLVLRNADGDPVYTGRRKNLLDLNELPFPAYHKLVGYPEVYSLPIFNYPTVPNGSCLSSRGCPYACSYCDRSVFNRTFRYNSADYLYRHMAYLKDTYNLKHLNFYDDQFTFNRQRVVDFCSMIEEKPLGMTFNCAARAEHLDAELLYLMKKAGCWMISLGIETGDEQLLARHRQNPDLAMMRDKIELIKKAGIRVKGLLMMGLPGETEESIEKSRNYVYSLPIDDFNLAKFTPFPGSPIYEQIRNGEDVSGDFDEDWEKMDCMQFRFVPQGMTQDRLDELFIDFYKKHFQRPSVLWGYVTMLWKSPDSWYRFMKSLTGFLRYARAGSRIHEDSGSKKRTDLK